MQSWADRLEGFEPRIWTCINAHVASSRTATVLALALDVAFLAGPYRNWHLPAGLRALSTQLSPALWPMALDDVASLSSSGPPSERHSGKLVKADSRRCQRRPDIRGRCKSGGPGP